MAKLSTHEQNVSAQRWIEHLTVSLSPEVTRCVLAESYELEDFLEGKRNILDSEDSGNDKSMRMANLCGMNFQRSAALIASRTQFLVSEIIRANFPDLYPPQIKAEENGEILSPVNRAS